jgi:hypothetical protein
MRLLLPIPVPGFNEVILLLYYKSEDTVRRLEEQTAVISSITNLQSALTLPNIQVEHARI